VPKITIKVQATMKKQKLKIEIQRQNGNTYLSFEVEPSLEKLFKKQSQEIRESIGWKGLKFYFIPNLTQSENYKQLLANYRLIDDFGVTLYEERCFNIAFLRTVGGKGKIKVRNDLSFAEVSMGVENIISFMKRYYEEYLKDYTVKGFLSFEVQTYEPKNQ